MLIGLYKLRAQEEESVRNCNCNCNDDARAIVFGILQSPPKSLKADLDIQFFIDGDERQEKTAKNAWIVDLKILAALDIVEQQYVHRKNTSVTQFL